MRNWIFVLIALAAPGTTQAQTIGQLWDRCISTNYDLAIGGCTALIQNQIPPQQIGNIADHIKILKSRRGRRNGLTPVGSHDVPCLGLALDTS